MKKCIVCNVDKDITAFSKHSRTIDGIRSICKKCIPIASKDYYERKKELIKNKSKQFYNDNKEDCLASQKKYYTNNKKEILAKNKIYVSNNRENTYKNQTKWANNNRNKVNESQKKWRENNKGIKNSLTAKRRASRKKATPPWISKAQLAEITDIYKQAKELEAIFFNRKFHVDHIVPLQGKNVSGLHVPWNLQILTAEDNIRKGNRMYE